MFKRFFLFVLITLAANCDAMLASISKNMGGMNFTSGMMYRGFANVVSSPQANLLPKVKNFINSPEGLVTTAGVCVVAIPPMSSLLYNTKAGKNTYDWIKKTARGENSTNNEPFTFKEVVANKLYFFTLIPHCIRELGKILLAASPIIAPGVIATIVTRSPEFGVLVSSISALTTMIGNMEASGLGFLDL